jgi:dihydrodipicolinate synthase/N-acetylneuraminate lyase
MKPSTQQKNEGLVGPWAALPIAWSPAGEFEETPYRADVAKCCAAGIPGIFMGGATGEFYALEVDEFRAVARATIKECEAHGKPALIGCTATHTRGVIHRVETAVELGARAIMVALPFWLEVGDDQVVPFFQEVAAAAGGLPVVFEETLRAKKLLTVRQHQEIKDAVPSYGAVHATADTVGTTPAGCQTLARLVKVLVHEELWSALGPKGAVGSCSLMVCWNPRLILGLWKSLQNKDWVTLGIARGRIRSLWKFLDGEFGPKGFTDTAYARMGARATGFLQTSLHNRAPYRSATEGDVELFRQWCGKGYPELLDLQIR